MAAADVQEWELVKMPAGEAASAFKRRKVDDAPLVSGPWNIFSLHKPEGFKLPVLADNQDAILTELRSNLPSAGIAARRASQSEASMAPAPFVDMLLPDALQARTENNAATFSSSGNALLDFFYQVVESSSCSEVHDLLNKGWREGPLTMLQLIAHLRDIRNGKGEIARGLDAYVWLARHHPRTLLANLVHMVECGYWKDLLELLDRLCVGEEEWTARVELANVARFQKGKNHENRKLAKKDRLKEWRSSVRAPNTKEGRDAMKAERAAANAETVKAQADEDRQKRHEEQRAAIERALQVYRDDSVYRALHTAVAVLFADQLRRDLADLQAGKSVSSLAVKWAPTPKGHHDKDTLIGTAIAELLFPEAQYRPEGMPYEDYAELARRSYQKHYTSVLRAAAPITEALMSKRKWSEIDYSRVASVCMMRNKKTFAFQDKERLREFLVKVKKGEAKINAGALKPHELVHEAMLKTLCSWMSGSGSDSDADITAEEKESASGEEEMDTSIEVMEAQWKAYVEKLRESGELSSALAICDVSGSMEGQPMEVAIALSLLTAEVTEPPFNKLICTFSSVPELHLVKGDTLVKQVEDIKSMQWNQNTDINAVFNLLLQRAVESKLKPEDMIKTLFIFSDMEFDEATSRTPDYHSRYLGQYGTSDDGSDGDGSEVVTLYQNLSLGGQKHVTSKRTSTNYETVKAAFEMAGYRLPQVVFWNLSKSRISGQKSTPVTMNEQGVALVSGFSGHMLKLFMEKGGDVEAWKEGMNPMSVMIAAIRDSGCYDTWKVED